MRSHIGSRARRFALVAIASLLPAGLAAQSQVTTLVGSIRDSAGHAVSGVEVRLNGGALLGRTNDSGGFRIGAVPVGRTTVGVRRMGFAPTTAEVMLRANRVDSLVLTLSATALSLPGVLVEDEAMTRSKRLLAGFWERRSRGFGSFLTREQVEARNTSDFAELVRMIPSAYVMNVNGRNTIRFKRNAGTRDCPPQFWVDGMRVERAEADEFSPQEVEAVEVYPGPATIPVQFMPRPNSYTCGAVVIWTRLPGT